MGSNCQHPENGTGPDRALDPQEGIRALLDGQPYGSVVAYAFGPDLKTLAFATPVETHKSRQLCACDRVALVVDSKPSAADQIMQGEAITATGQASEVGPGTERERLTAHLAARDPQIAPFFSDHGSAVFRVDVTAYAYVRQFQMVQHWRP
jgi:hypothetical protein